MCLSVLEIRQPGCRAFHPELPGQEYSVEAFRRVCQALHPVYRVCRPGPLYRLCPAMKRRQGHLMERVTVPDVVEQPILPEQSVLRCCSPDSLPGLERQEQAMERRVLWVNPVPMDCLPERPRVLSL